MFVAKRSTLTGKVEWIANTQRNEEEEEGSDEEELGTNDGVVASMHLDMLNDNERNQCYYQAISQVCKDKVVLDIGTGSGLLSMMAAKKGAKKVNACEVYKPMAFAAKALIKENNFSQVIKVISKRSTDIQIGKDVNERADVLITEILDSELLGEGIIPCIRHALKELLSENAIVVPFGATIYAQLFESDEIRKFHDIPSILNVGLDNMNCSGTPHPFNIQASYLKNLLTPLSKPFKVFEFEFQKVINDEMKEIQVPIIQNGKCHILLFWWDLYLTENISFSTAPLFNQKNGHTIQNENQDRLNGISIKPSWRDHWMQSVIFFRNVLEVQKNENIQIEAFHNDYNVSFKIIEKDQEKDQDHFPNCTCQNHTFFSPNRIKELNCIEREKTFKNILIKYFNEKKDLVCVDIGDSSILSLLAAEIGFKKIYSIESSLACFKHFQQISKLKSFPIQFINKEPFDVTLEDFGQQKINLLMSEPFSLNFQNDLPWKSYILYWFICSHLKPYLSENYLLLPESACLKAELVYFSDLFKSHAPVKNVCDFEYSRFNDVACLNQPLTVTSYLTWMYEYQSVSSIETLLNFNFRSEIETIQTISTFQNISNQVKPNGIRIWIESLLDKESILLSPERRDAVIFLDTSLSSPLDFLQLTTTFDSVSGEIQFLLN